MLNINEKRMLKVKYMFGKNTLMKEFEQLVSSRRSRYI